MSGDTTDDLITAIAIGGECQHVINATMRLRWVNRIVEIGDSTARIDHALQQATKCIACGKEFWEDVPTVEETKP